MSTSKYFIINKDCDSGFMFLGPMPQLPSDDDNWMFGEAFTKAPEEPIIVDIDDDHEDKPPFPFYQNPQIASNEFIDALIEVGVDNLDTYDAELETMDETSVTIA